MKRYNLKKCTTVLLALTLVISGVALMPNKAQASEETEKVVKFQDVDYSTFEDCIDDKKAPVCTLENNVAEDKKVGYLFAGWFTKEGNPIKEKADANNAETVAAKFIPSYLTGIACQVKANAGVEGVDKTNLRIVSLVHSTNYEAVGFNVYGRDDYNGDGLVDEWVMYQYSSTTTNKAQSTKVYSGLQVYKLDDSNNLVADGEPKTPADIFGADAEGFKFTTMNLSSIPEASYNTIMAIKPYWITLDGTVVEGMGEFDRVSDSKLVNEEADVVNVSVNIKDASAIAAGMLDVSYSTLNFKYLGADYGRVFEEMEVNPDEVNGIVKCVGNVEDVEANSTKANEVYVNLRFQKTAENSLAKGAAEFSITIPEKGFCDIDENTVTDLSVWDIKY